MKKWNVELYRKLIKNAADQKKVDGTAVKNKEAVYMYLCNKLNMSYDTVKGWIRWNSNGPGDPERLLQLEEIFGTKLTEEVKENKEMTMENIEYSDFVKEQIMDCYSLMKDYIVSEDVQDENAYCEMRAEMGKKCIAIPSAIYKKIDDFANENLDPIIYDYENTFAECHTSDMGHYDEDGTFHIETEEQLYKQAGVFMNILMSIEDKLDDFAMRELYPILAK